MARSTALQKMLGEILAAVERPNGGQNFAASYLRNQHIQKLLAAKALDAAEEAYPGFESRVREGEEDWREAAALAAEAAEKKWPGFMELTAEMVEREKEFLKRAGPVA